MSVRAVLQGQQGSKLIDSRFVRGGLAVDLLIKPSSMHARLQEHRSYTAASSKQGVTRDNTYLSDMLRIEH